MVVLEHPMHYAVFCPLLTNVSKQSGDLALHRNLLIISGPVECSDVHVPVLSQCRWSSQHWWTSPDTRQCVILVHGTTATYHCSKHRSQDSVIYQGSYI